MSDPVLLPCPFCGKPPSVKTEAPRIGWQHASVYISCRGFGHECRSSGSRMVREWVGNDVPMREYRTDDEGMREAMADAARGWNQRPPNPESTT